MAGTREIFLKELADNLNSKRFWILFFIIYALGLFTVLGALQNLGIARTGGKFAFLRLFSIGGENSFPFLWVIIYLAPLLGSILTFDTINREISSGTLSNVVSQPVHRDSIINGKFLAGITIIALTLIGVIFLVIGFGIITLSALPSLEEIARIFAFFFLSIVYLSFWVSIGLLCSTLFRREGTSALVSVTTWLFFSFFIFMIASPIGGDALLRFSPAFLFAEGSFVILIPTTRILGPVSIEKLTGMLPNPLPLDQSLLLIWPHITTLIAATIIVFALSYVRFMRQEIKAI